MSFTFPPGRVSLWSKYTQWNNGRPHQTKKHNMGQRGEKACHNFKRKEETVQASSNLNSIAQLLHKVILPRYYL